MKPFSARERRVRRLIQVGACVSAFGIAIAVAGDEAVSRWLVVGGLVLMILGLHRFGRLGTDELA